MDKRGGLLALLLITLVTADTGAQKTCPTTCKDGRDGRDGRDGVSVAGPAGKDGKDGTDGKDCIECARGPKGPSGDKGQKGETGNRGPPGSTGQTGDTGKAGPAGEKGEKGEVGNRGSTGPAGAQGVIGPTGKQGKPGVPGVCDIKELNALKSELETLKLKQQAFCSTLPTNKCGSCSCVDDSRVEGKYYCDCQKLAPQRDCLTHYTSGSRIDGIYMVTVKSKKYQVFCDMNTDGGGWTVFQRRRDGSVNFFRDWQTYKDGFGDFQNEFWLGNDNLYLTCLQSDPKGSELRVDMTSFQNQQRYAKYSHFQIGDEGKQYILSFGTYSGDAGNALAHHNGRKFSTYDKDNDNHAPYNCAQYYRGAFWYGHCYDAHPNGRYFPLGDAQVPAQSGIIWNTFVKQPNQLKHIEMKIRRLQ